MEHTKDIFNFTNGKKVQPQYIRYFVQHAIPTTFFKLTQWYRLVPIILECINIRIRKSSFIFTKIVRDKNLNV